MFEVITGLGTRPGAVARKVAIAELRSFARELTANYGHQIDFIIKDEDQAHQLPRDISLPIKSLSHWIEVSTSYTMDALLMAWSRS